MADADKKAVQDNMTGVAELLGRRGDEQVRFAQVADHLVDFVARNPGTEEVVDRLARFLTRVEGVDHRHEARYGSSGV